MLVISCIIMQLGWFLVFFFCKILYLDKFFYLVTTTRNDPSKHSKHFRKVADFAFQKLQYVGTLVSRRGHFQDFHPRFGFWHICHVYQHGHFTLKQLRLPVASEKHTNSYTGLRLKAKGQNFSCTSVAIVNDQWIFLFAALMQ